MCQCHVPCAPETQIWRFSTKSSSGFCIQRGLFLCRSHLMMPHCCVLWATSPWTTSTTRKRGTCPRGVAPEHRDRLHALHSGSNTGKRWAVLFVLVLIITLGDPLFHCFCNATPSGGFRMPTSKAVQSQSLPCQAAELRQKHEVG